MRIDLPNIIGSGELWLDIVKTICGDTSDKSMVDLMCHHAPYTPLLGFKNRIYVDINNRPLDDKNEQQYFIQSEVIDYLLNNLGSHCDVSICSDGIEHLTIEDGKTLLSLMMEASDKQIIFTPLGEYMVSSDTNDNNPDSHRSGWFPEMIPEYLAIVIPDFHPSLNSGAWFAVNCDDNEKQRIYNEIKNLYVQN